jgi:LacI family transcriptional regulator
MTDVARDAGVSQTTVSFVLNDRRDVVVAEDTRARVLDAAGRLGYRMNRMAQALRLNRSYTVGIITNGIVSQPYAGLIVRGIQNAVQPSDYVCMTVDTTDDPAGGDEAVANLLDRRVAGIIYASPSPKPVHRSSLLDGTRTVFVNCWPSEAETEETVILADEYTGGLAAASRAFALGHRNVAFLGGELGEYAWQERRRGFVDAARSAGLDPDRLPQLTGDYSIGSGYDLTMRAFDSSRPSALICGNDRMAIGALLGVHALGLECPTDVGIIGFDDQPDVASQVRPALTTVALPHLQMGYRAGTLLIDDTGDLPTRIVVPCRLVDRDSILASSDTQARAPD